MQTSPLPSRISCSLERSQTACLTLGNADTRAPHGHRLGALWIRVDVVLKGRFLLDTSCVSSSRTPTACEPFHPVSAVLQITPHLGSFHPPLPARPALSQTSRGSSCPLTMRMPCCNGPCRRSSLSPLLPRLNLSPPSTRRGVEDLGGIPPLYGHGQVRLAVRLPWPMVPHIPRPLIQSCPS
ncbi:hypothetical protein BV20DRAFT_416604 [Pilatotrama ljubarskyi]|nr:hypothetical protein BV20DRAFT_416604 [Pilatotrama ljubarskyi]